MNPNRWWQVGTLLPAVMVVTFVADIAMRFMPLDILAFRTWEAVLRESDEGLGPFKPNYVYMKRHTYGDLANLGNMASPRDYHDESSRMDGFGYRNSYPADQPHPGGLLIGDSFAVGGPVPQNMTLPEQLTRLGDVRFYNAGGRSEQTPNSVHAIASRLDMTSGIVIYEVLERSARGSPPPIAGLGTSAPTPDALDASAAAVQEHPSWFDAYPLAKTIERRIRRFREDPWAFADWYDARSPMKIISRKAMKKVQDDVLQPNVYAHNVVRRRLTNNDEMLFFPRDFGTVDDLEKLEAAWVSYLSTFADRLAEQQLKMIVLLVPNKATVYEPLMEGTPAETDGERLLAGLQEKLGKSGICAVDLTPVYRRYEEEELPQKQYLYWRDDSHWNARGIGVAAHELLPCIRTAQAAAPHQ